jgi:hypothetical protein
MANTLTIGERVAWYRRRRGLSQECLPAWSDVLRTGPRKIENNHIELDRLSVIKALAGALDITLGDLIGDPSLLDWTPDSGIATVTALRSALMDYRAVTPFGRRADTTELPSVVTLHREVGQLWSAYQDARFGYVAGALPQTLSQLQDAADGFDGEDQDRARRLLGPAYQLTATQLTKLGEADLAWIAADRGLAAVRPTGDPLVTGSLFRSVSHTLHATGRFREAVKLTEDAAAFLQPHLNKPSPAMLSVYGTLFLTGAMAAARDNDASTTRTFLTAADEAASRLGTDANHVWTTFGPTNVAIHRVATAGELGNVQVAVDLAPRVDASALPMERRVRHALEVARAYSSWNRTDDARATLLEAEQLAPEQVRHHYLSRQLVLTWIRRQRGKPPTELAALARRLKVLG